MVAACDRSQTPLYDVGDAIDELVDTREQRDQCAAKVDALREWSNRAN